MAHTLLLRLQGPMQAWGATSRFSVRETTREPTKSGVIGLLCAALGRDRHASLADLMALRMGARVDREGTLMVDFHTAQEVLNSQGGVLGNAVLSTRYYLADAVFLVGLESQDAALLKDLQAALRRPRWLLCLGRRAFPPAEPIWLPGGLKMDTSLEAALREFPWLVKKPRTEYQQKKLPVELRFALEDPLGPTSRADNPVSYAERLFVQRQVSIYVQKAPARFWEDVEGK